MDWINRMNDAMNYIESNLGGEILYDKAAQLACCSTYHFQRMFSFITSVPLSEYIKRRRLTLAAFELQNGAKVIDTALKYGYDAPESFSRAFKLFYGIPPSEARKNNVKLKAYPRMSFHISIRGDKEMNYRIEEKPAFTVFGISRKINRSTVILGDPKDEVGNFWNEIIENGEFRKIEELAQGEATLEMSWHGENGEAFSGYDDAVSPYLIGAFKKDGSINTQGYLEVNIPAAAWAIFPTEEAPYGSGLMAEYMRETNARIWSEWLPSSCYEIAELPHLGVFICTDKGEYVEYWIPVVKGEIYGK